MKNYINKLLVAGVMAVGISSMATAASSEDKQSAAGIDPEVESTLAVSEDHNQQMDDLNREKELLELQGSLAKLKLEKEKTNVELKKLKGLPIPTAAVVAPAVTALPGVPDFTPTVPLNGLDVFESQPQLVQPPRSQSSVQVSPLDRVYVTRVYGVGGVTNVTVYFDNGLFTGAVGDEVFDGLKIVKITDNGAVFSYKGKTKNVNITARSIAYSRSQAQAKSSERKNQSTANSQQGGIASSFSPQRMATEIGSGTNVPPPHPR